MSNILSKNDRMENVLCGSMGLFCVCFGMLIGIFLESAFGGSARPGIIWLLAMMCFLGLVNSIRLAWKLG